MLPGLSYDEEAGYPGCPSRPSRRVNRIKSHRIGLHIKANRKPKANKKCIPNYFRSQLCNRKPAAPAPETAKYITGTPAEYVKIKI